MVRESFPSTRTRGSNPNPDLQSKPPTKETLTCSLPLVQKVLEIDFGALISTPRLVANCRCNPSRAHMDVPHLLPPSPNPPPSATVIMPSGAGAWGGPKARHGPLPRHGLAGCRRGFTSSVSSWLVNRVSSMSFLEPHKVAFLLRFHHL